MTIDATAEPVLVRSRPPAPAARSGRRRRRLARVSGAIPALLALLLGGAAAGCAPATEAGGGRDAPEEEAGNTAGEPDPTPQPVRPPDAPPVPEAIRVARPDSGTAWVFLGSETVVAEVAATEAARSRGLQGRDSVPAGTGMLFVYPDRRVRSFWMVGTTVPLDIAFLDRVPPDTTGAGWPEDGVYRVVDIQTMEPMTHTLHRSAGPAVMALEMAAGSFAEAGVEAGHRIRVVFGPDGGG